MVVDSVHGHRQAALRAARWYRKEKALHHLFWTLHRGEIEGFSDTVDAELDGLLTRLVRPRTGGPRRHAGRPRLAHIHPYFLDGGGHTSALLAALEFHDPARMDVQCWSIELENSQHLGPQSLQQARQMRWPVELVSPPPPEERDPPRATSFLWQKAESVYRRLVEERVDIALFYPCTTDVISPLVAAMRPPALTVMFDTNNLALNVGPYLFDVHLDVGQTVSRRCQARAPAGAGRFSHIEYLPEYVSSHMADHPLPPPIEVDIPPGAVVSAKIGDLYKLQVGGCPDYFNMLDQLMRAVPNLWHLLVGRQPDLETFQRTMDERYGGRVRCLGARLDVPVSAVLARIDLYINSFPWGGGCTLHEAAAAGRPVVTLKDRWDDPYRVVFADHIGDPRLVGDSPDDLVPIIRDLCASEARRRASGQACKQFFLDHIHARRTIPILESTLIEQLGPTPPP